MRLAAPIAASRFSSSIEPLQSNTRQTFVRIAPDARGRPDRERTSKRHVTSDGAFARTVLGSTVARSSSTSDEGIEDGAYRAAGGAGPRIDPPPSALLAPR